MNNLLLRLMVLLVLFIVPKSIIADTDTTFNRLSIGIHSDFLLGQSIFLKNDEFENRNHAYSFGLYVGMNLSAEQSIRMGLAVNKSIYDFRIIKRDVLTINGSTEDQEQFNEHIDLLSGSLGLSFSRAFSERALLSVEFLAYKLFDEKRNRDGIGILTREGTLVQGIDYTSRKNHFGLKSRYEYMVNSYVRFGAIMLLSNEILLMPKLDNDSSINLWYGIYFTLSV